MLNEMFTQVRSRTNPYQLYIGIDVVNSFATAIAYTTAIVYRVRSGHLNPLQLVLLGTMVEICYLVMQLPSGVLADLVSRRLCVIAGQFLEAAGILMQGLSPHFAVQLLLCFVFFVGMWSESFDRLWGAYLLKDISFPHAFGPDVVIWFSILAVVTTLLSLGSTEWAKRRTSKLGPGSIPPTLLALTVATALAVVLMASTSAFIPVIAAYLVVVIAAYLVVATLRPVFSPLVTGWVVGRVDSSVCATALSATDLLESAGQIVGGPIVGAIGVLASVRAALLAGGVALAPAAALLAAAARRAGQVGQ